MDEESAFPYGGDRGPWSTSPHDGERGPRAAATHDTVEGRPPAYRPLAPRLDAVAPSCAAEIAALEATQHQIRLLLTDERVAKRLTRRARRRTTDALLGAFADATTNGRKRRTPYRELDETPRDRVTHYTRLLDRLGAVKPPQDTAALARIHSAMHGREEGTRWRRAKEVWGTDESLMATPPPAATPDLVARTLQWAGDTEAHPVLVAAGLTGEMLAIRPFEDGNLPLAALLLRLTLHHGGYAGADLIPLKESWDRYEESLRVLARSIREDDARHWTSHFLTRLRSAYERTLDDAMFTTALIDETNERQWRLALWFRDQAAERPDHPWRFREIQNASPNVAQRTLKRDLSRLRELGVIQMEGKLKSARYRYIGKAKETLLAQDRGA